MANKYYTATNTGKNFFTHQDRHDFYLSGHAGDVWIVEDNSKGAAWINKVNGTSKLKAEAQAIVDAKIEEFQVSWDALSPEPKDAGMRRPEKYTLP